MSLDLKKLSDKELEFIANGDMGSLSDETLQMIVDSNKPVDKVSKSKLSGPIALGSELIKGRLGAEVKNTAEEAKQQGLGFVEGATAGIPRGIAEFMTGKDLSSLRGNKVGQASGFVASPLKLASKAGKVVKGSGLLSVLGRGAVEGAVSGALLPNEDSLNVVKRGEQAKTGALLGAAGNVVLDRASKIIGGYNKYKEATKKIKELGDERFKLQDPMGKDAVRLEEITKQEEMLRNSIKQPDKEKLAAISAELSKRAEATAKGVKSPLLRKIRAYKESWGDRFDALLEGSPSTTKASDVIKDIDNTYAELERMGVDLKGKPISELDALRSRMERLISTKQTTSGINESEDIANDLLGLARKKPTVTESIVDPIVDNRALANELRNVRKSLSSKARSSGDFTSEDIAGSIFSKNFSERVKGIDGMDELYSEYSEFKKMSDYAYKTFKPSRDSINTSSRVLKNIGLGKATPDDLAGVEKISKFMNGDVSKGVRNIGDRLRYEQITSAKNIEALNNRISERLAKLKAEKESISKADSVAKYAIDSAIRDNQKILDQLSLIKSAKVMGKTVFKGTIEAVTVVALLKMAGLGGNRN